MTNTLFQWFFFLQTIFLSVSMGVVVFIHLNNEKTTFTLKSVIKSNAFQSIKLTLNEQQGRVDAIKSGNGITSNRMVISS